ncbi:hypothetical protein E0K89_017795 [Aquicoccus sp. SCR17]|nr:hypothetical protein [Carideicomes alvinocaridis]
MVLYPATEPSHESVAGWPSITVTRLQVEGRAPSNRSTWLEREVRACPEIVECWLMTGSFDYLLRISVPDLNDFESFLTGQLTKIPGVV